MASQSLSMDPADRSIMWYKQADLEVILQGQYRHVRNQIVLTGRPTEIKEVVQAVNDANPAGLIDPDPAYTIQIDTLFNGLTALEPVARYAGIEIQLYKMAGDDSEAAIWSAIKAVYEKATDKGVIVFADPNLVAGTPASGGSGGINGAPDGNSGYCAPNNVFKEHWVFGSQWSNKYSKRWGINLESGPGKRTVEQRGKGARVFIFDTCPDELGVLTPVAVQGQAIVNISQTQEKEVKRSCMDLPMKLSISRLPALVRLSSTQLSSAAHHGLYVAGLLHRVAPEAELNLVEILNGLGRGELFTLASALAAVAADQLQKAAKPAQGEHLPLSNMVINLSLEATFSEDLIWDTGVRDAIVELYDATNAKLRAEVEAVLQPEHLINAEFEQRLEEGFEKALEKKKDEDALYALLSDMKRRFYYVPSLRIPIQILYQLGAVIVAAAGNHSAQYYGHLPMSIPARYPEVISAAASNFEGELSSFSNASDVRAPGGGDDDEENDTIDINKIRRPGIDISPYAMVSLVPEKAEYPEGLAYWWGTSFSTPLVSGLAALIIGKCGGNGPELDFVKETIRNNSRLNVINVEDTLAAIK